MENMLIDRRSTERGLVRIAVEKPLALKEGVKIWIDWDAETLDGNKDRIELAVFIDNPNNDKPGVAFELDPYLSVEEIIAGFSLVDLASFFRKENKPRGLTGLASHAVKEMLNQYGTMSVRLHESARWGHVAAFYFSVAGLDFEAAGPMRHLEEFFTIDDSDESENA